MTNFGAIQFLHPVWFAGIAAVVVPVILHLWNDRRGKVMRVGSVALLRTGERRMAWRRVTQWWLLVVRCLMLMMLAVMMAGPVLRTRIKGWVLTVGEEGVRARVGGEGNGARVGGEGDEARVGGRIGDSLVTAGWDRHTFQDSGNYWEGFRMADRAAPADVPFYIRTPDLARRFMGERPVTERQVRWDVYAPKDSAVRWVEAVWEVSPDSVEVLRGISRATGTAYRGEVQAWSATDHGARSGVDAVVVDTSVLRVKLPDEGSGYVLAAVKALRQYTRRRMEVTAGSGKSLKEKEVADWDGLVWSGAFPVWLENVVVGEVGSGEKDRRVLDGEQIMPMKGEAGGSELKGVVSAVGVGGRPDEGVGESGVGAEGSGAGSGGLLWGSWLVVMLLFILERILSHGQRKT